MKKPECSERLARWSRWSIIWGVVGLSVPACFAFAVFLMARHVGHQGREVLLPLVIVSCVVLGCWTAASLRATILGARVVHDCEGGNRVMGGVGMVLGGIGVCGVGYILFLLLSRRLL